MAFCVKIKYYALVTILLSVQLSYAGLQVPTIFGDGMVLQRNRTLVFWGNAAPLQKVSISVGSSKGLTTANSKGEWKIELAPLPAGGPYVVNIQSASESIKLNDVWVGDVWICSGQSNMAFTLGQSGINPPLQYPNGKVNIRQMSIHRLASALPMGVCSHTGWIPADSLSIKDFTAVGYYAAYYRQLQNQVPIGIINSSWGGSSIEYWTPKEYVSPSSYSSLLHRTYDSILGNNSVLDYRKLHKPRCDSLLNTQDPGWKYNYTSGVDIIRKGDPVCIPQSIEESIDPDFDGRVWYATSFYIDSLSQHPWNLQLGILDDKDEIFVNDQKIGETESYTHFRSYHILPNTFKKGLNLLVVRIVDAGGSGGFVDNFVPTITNKWGHKQYLNKTWKYRMGLGLRMDTSYLLAKYAYRTDWRPATIFNAMIAPLANFPISSVIWYQGESNSDQYAFAKEYQKALTSLIEGWRSVFKYEKLPFYIVQLPLLGRSSHHPPKQSGWAFIRETQAMSYHMPNVLPIPTLDLGDPLDIHPKNKKEVGIRIAQSMAGIPIPKMHSYLCLKESCILRLSPESPIFSLNPKMPITGFSVSEDGKSFVWAPATLLDSLNIEVRVPSPSIKSLRFAYESNPTPITLYSLHGLPLGPFSIEISNYGTEQLFKPSK